jgi:SAM-dependent methyltransferase
VPFDVEWEDLHKKYFWGTEPNQYLLKFLDENFEHNRPYTFLDIGCGTGASAIPMLERGWNVLAVDGSLTALCRLAKRIDEAKPSGKAVLFKGDMNNIDFKTDTFDGIVDANTLSQMTLAETVKITQSARRWLKLGGKFYSRQLTLPYSDKWLRTSFTRMCENDQFKPMFAGYEGSFEKLSALDLEEGIISYFDFRLTLVRKVVEVPDFDGCEIYHTETRHIMTG